MTTSIPLSAPAGDRAALRVQHELLRFVREAADSGAPLPGELELTSRLGCTRQQLRNAMSSLEAQGIVRRRQGTVTTVDPIALRLSVRMEEQFEHTDLLSRLGYRASVEVLSAATATLPPQAAALMEFPPSTRAQCARKRWHADEAVAMVADDAVPLKDDVEPRDGESIFDLAHRVWGEPVIWEVSTPGVALLDAPMAATFELPEGTPVMTFELVGVGASGRRLMYSLEYHNPAVAAYSVVRTVRPPWHAG
ncbi:GntR family transcriptional regulator [Microbacterium sp. SSW1-59]|uniref:GntR family transcriptional regulator n=1 Tax=Microbacterium xanthum TaxID=3079794 RepID=UPI002AD2E21E|nr:GntR family transcriptional regulator [Microbacterium sp. SSW1-59]MDZ8200444.1 GntR family transcriptional regulator [Microbacterium sp. SSW1-59]